MKPGGLLFTSLIICELSLGQLSLAQDGQSEAIEAAKRHEKQAQKTATLPSLYLEAAYRSAWLEGMSGEAERTIATFNKAIRQPVNPTRKSTTKTMAWDEKHFLFGYDKPDLNGANGQKRAVNHYFNHDGLIWQRQQIAKGAPQHVNLEMENVWRRVDARLFCHLRSARLAFQWGNSDGNIKFALVPIEFADYRHLGDETIDGTACWVVLSKPRRCKLWFDQESGRLVQMLNYVMEGVEPTPFQETPEVEKLCGRKFETLEAFREFAKRIDQATRQRLAGLYGLLYFDKLAHPAELTRFSDYREIAPGIWFPYQATDVFASQSPLDRSKFRYSQGVLRVTTLQTGQTLEKKIAALLPGK